MTLRNFADHYRLKLRRDDCRDEIIQGRAASFVCDGYGERLGLCLIFNTPRMWASAKKRLLAAEFEICQDGDTEGIATFNPADRVQVRLALKLAGVRPRKQASQAQLAALAAARDRLKSRQTPATEGFRTLDSTQPSQTGQRAVQGHSAFHAAKSTGGAARAEGSL